MARDVVARGLSVRETEQLVTRAMTKKDAPPAPKAEKVLDVHTRAAQDKLRMTLGTKVDIVRRSVGGEIRVSFKNEDELQRIYEILTD
jgi:ParB family chromosome partitioning protein